MSRRHLHASAHSPDHSFTIEQFESLVSSALDIQGISESALSFAFGGTVYPPSSALSDSDRKAQRRKTGTFSRLRDVFFTKRSDASVPSSRPLPPETRRLASKSVPAFSPLQSPPPLSSKSLINLDLGHSYLDFPSLPCPTTPAAALTYLPSPASNDFSTGSASDGPSSAISPCETPSPNARSFLNLKPLSIPKLIRKPSGPPSPYFPPTPPDQMASLPVSSSTVDNEPAHAETDGLRSFFDDSGFEEDLRMFRSKSRAGFRSFFSSTAPENGCSPGRSRYEHKALPPTPVTTESTRATRRSKSSRPNDTSNSRCKSDDRVASHFPPSSRKPALRNANSDSLKSPESKPKLDIGTNRMADWIVRSAGSAPRTVSRPIKASSPPYPSPTSPLPPTPKLQYVGLPASRLSTSTRMPTTGGEGDTSLDSVEILSWRMPNLKQRVSKSSTSSRNRAHAMGRPSRGSIRERLGLGTRLHVHVPSPAQFLSDSVKMSEFQEGRRSLASFANDEDRQHPGSPSSAGTPSSARIPLPRLASASFVSLRSIATITAANKGREWSEDAGREDALEVDRAFTPDDDPFAADPLTPISPANSIFDSRVKKERYRSFMPLGNDSSVSLVSNEIPISAPASLPTWHYRLGSNPNLSSPAFSLRKDLQDMSKPPSPLAEALGIRDRTPSPLCPENSHRSLNRAISRVKKIQSDISVYPRRNIKPGSSAVGYTQSRPHSPFPMILRPGIGKSVPTIKREIKRPSVASIVWNGANGQVMGTSLARPPLSPQWEPRLDGHCPRQVAEPYAPSVKDTDAFGDAARCNMVELPERSMASPTAWLLDMDDYDDAIPNLAEQSNVLALDLTAANQATGRRDSYEDCRTVKTDESPRTADIQSSPPSRVLREPENESGIDGDTPLLRSSQNWPLPPPCTVIVDEDSGEGHHVVEPVLEFVQTDSIPKSPRNSTHFPKRHSGCASIESRSSRGSQRSPPVLRKLGRSQTRLLAKQFGRSHACDEGHTVASPSSFHSPDNLRTDRLYERSRSTTSLASAGTAFYSARSTPSRGSDKSTFSFANSRNRGTSSNERSSKSSRSPRGSSDYQTRDAVVRLEPNLASHCTSA